MVFVRLKKFNFKEPELGFAIRRGYNVKPNFHKTISGELCLQYYLLSLLLILLS